MKNPPSFVEAGPRKNLYHDPQSVKVAVLTSGGIAPGLNTVVEAIVRRHFDVYDLKTESPHLGKFLGFQRDFVGLEEDRYQELDQRNVEAWCRFGGSRLGVGRGGKDTNRWLHVLKTHAIDILYVIGGNGSLTAAWKLAEAAKKENLNLSIGVVPKTMDNDILWVWQSFGFVTAFDKAAEVINVLHTEAESNYRICVI
jgi:6-phosphofructokinase 1